MLISNLPCSRLPHPYGLLHLDALYDVDGLFHDGVWILSCHVLYVHAPLRAADQHWTLRRHHHQHQQHYSHQGWSETNLQLGHAEECSGLRVWSGRDINVSSVNFFFGLNLTNILFSLTNLEL